MGDTYRSTRVYRDDDDDRYRTTTVTRYKVGPGRGERVVEVEEDRRSGFGRRTSNDLLDDRRWPGERPRSAYDPGTERSRTYTYEREVERDHRHTPERSRFTTQDSRESDNWDKRSRADEEVKVERKVEETVEDSRGNEIDRTRTQTEYYTQPSRQQPNILVQEAPSQGSYGMGRQDPGVMVLREREMDREVVRSRDPYEEDYYYRNDRRDVGPYRGDRDYAMARYDPRRGRDYGYYSDEDDYYYNRRSRRHRSRDRSRSSSGGRDKHHKLHLAEGALAGAGVAALLQSKRNEYGELPENRGRKVVAGAALGALGTEVLKRAHSAYEERWGDGRESPDHHSKLKTGLGIAAVALAAAGAAKYMQSGKIEREEAHRGRSRTRGYDSDDGGSRSRSRPASRKRSLSTMAKAALGTAATAGIIRHFSKSRSRKGSRSKSKLRRGAEIAGAAAAAGIAGKMWKDHKEKKEERERSRSRAESRSVNGDDYYGQRHYSRSRSRSRSIARSHHSDMAADRELGLVEYGNEPLPPDRQDRRRERRRRDRSSSSDSADDRKRSRSRSRLRNMAAAGAAAGAAAVGINEYKKRKDKKERDRRSRERSRDRSRDRSEDRK